MTYISNLTLSAFRNYDSAAIQNLDNQFIILIGENGAGKTNCLEGISLLSPGRGLRGAKPLDMQSQDNPNTWAVSALITDNDGDHIRLGVGRDPQKPHKKIIRADGNPIKNQNDLGDILRTIWLTPQMDGLFLQASSERRRFFDRLVATFDPAHAGRMIRVEKATRDRLNILRDAVEKKVRPDAIWLDALEKIIVETSVAIAAARNDICDHINQAIRGQKLNDFPLSKIILKGDFEHGLRRESALGLEDFALSKFQSMRDTDGHSGRTNFGIGRTDMSVIYTDKNVDAGQCSTGEQKSLLTTIILAHARMVAARFGAPPLLLFDEITAHFDAKRRDALFDILTHLDGQIWLTGQDEKSFLSVNNKQIIKVENNKLLT